jgi:VWFA-related protein
MKTLSRKMVVVALVALACGPWASPLAQRRNEASGRDGGRRGPVSTVTIPVTVRLPDKPPQTELQYLAGLAVYEDGEPQEILTTRGAARSPLTLAVLIQDDLVSSVSSEIRDFAEFIRRLPPGSRVMVGYLRGGSLQVRQKWTTDLERAAKSLRIPASSTAVAPYNPFTLTRDAIKRFESQPVGRRALVLVSDGVDISRGVESSSPSQSLDLQRAINEAQRRGVAVYSIFAPTVWGNRALIGNGQGSLNRLSQETGGRAFFQGSGAPVSVRPFLGEIETLLSRLFALTFLSTHPEKGFHRVRVVAELPEGDIYFPHGYTR